MDLRPPSAVREIARRLEDAGHATWGVGGAIRDALLGRASGDWDLATAARPEQVRRLFRRTVPIGLEHGTVGVLWDDDVLYEVTTFRKDVETFGRHAVVEFADTIEEDLARRDFTLNAVAWHPLTGDLRDPFGGRADIEARVLRTVGEPAERYAEDWLRVLRALRFAGQFELEIEPATWTALRAGTPRLTGLSAERVREELWKVLTARRASRALELYAEASALEVLYPELAAVRALEDGAVWRRTLDAVDSLPPSRPVLRLAALLHATGMPSARAPDLRGGTRYTGHEAFGARKAEDVARRLRASNAQIERVVRLVRHQSDLFPPDAPDSGIRRWLRDLGPDLVNDLFRLRFALWRGERAGGRPDDLLERWRAVRRVLAQRPVLEVGDLAIDGGDLKRLGLEPGPRFGEILRALLERVIDEPELNRRQRLLALVRDQLEAPR